MYWFAYSIIILFALIEYVTRKSSKVMYYIAMFILIAMICLRYGQGMDYFSYKHLYHSPVHGEAAYTLIAELFHRLAIPFEVFVACISLFMMVMIHRFIIYFSPMPMLSLVLFYPTIYLTYYYSAFRQAIAIAFFLGVMLKWLRDDKLVKYIAGCIFIALFHTSSFILISLVILKFVSVKKLLCLVPVSFAVGVMLYLPQTQALLKQIDKIKNYVGDTEISAFGILERVVMFLIITFLYHCVKEKGNHSMVVFLYKIYIVGFMISMALFPYSLLCSRMGAPFKAVELILIPMFICQIPAFRKLLFTFILCYTTLMLCKNMNAYIRQTFYYKDVNIFNYPYISVFDKESTAYYHSGWENILDK